MYGAPFCNRLHDHTAHAGFLTGSSGATRILQTFAVGQGECMTTHGGARLGWIGTGRMGSVLAQRLLEAGLDVAVYNRTRAKAEPLGEFGATVVDSPADLADRDIVFTMVGGSKDFEDVSLGEVGVLTRPDASPSMLIDSSTISVAASERVRLAAEARGTDVLAAPVRGQAEGGAARRPPIPG